MMKRDQQLVSYFLRAFNHQYGTSYKVVRWPDAENRQTPAVEAVAYDDNGETIAIEHTLIQPFEGERIDTDRFMKVFGKLEGNTDLMKPGYNVDVIVRVGAVRKGTKWEVVADRVREHIVESIPALGEGTKEESIAGLRFALSVTLVIQSHGPAEKDHVWISRYESGSATLKQVVRTALERKLPKLVAEKANRRMLLLEKADFAHGYTDVRTAIDVLSSEFPELAQVDEIWLALTPHWEREDVLFFCELFPSVMGRKLKLDLRTSVTTALGV